MLKSAQRTGDGTLDLINAAALDIANYAMGAAHRISQHNDYEAALEAKKFLQELMAKCDDPTSAEHKWWDRLNKSEVHGKSLMNGISFWKELHDLANREFPASGSPSIGYRDLQDACLVLMGSTRNLQSRIRSSIDDMVAEHVTPLKVLLQ